MRRRASGLPAGKTFDAWTENASPIPQATQQALRTLDWITRAENLCICGPSGTGKSHPAEALGHAAIDQGKTVAVEVEQRDVVALAGVLAGGSQLLAAVAGCDGQDLDVLADDGRGTREAVRFVEGGLEARQRLVVVVGVDK